MAQVFRLRGERLHSAPWLLRTPVRHSRYSSLDMADAAVAKPMKPDVPVVGLCIGLYFNTFFFAMCFVDFSIDVFAEELPERLPLLAMYYEWRASPPVLGLLLLIMLLLVLLSCI